MKAMRLSIGSWAYCFGPYQAHPVPFDEVVRELRRLGFDGYSWVRDGDLLPGRARAYTPTMADAGARVACQETVTYPAPLSVTAVAQSGDVLVVP